MRALCRANEHVKECTLKKPQAAPVRVGTPVVPTRASASMRTSLYSTVTLGKVPPAHQSQKDLNLAQPHCRRARLMVLIKAFEHAAI